MTARLLRGEGLTLAALVLLAAGLFVLPLGLLAREGLFRDGLPSLQPLLEALGSASVQRALWNSVASAGVSALGALLIGTVMALVIGLTDIRAKGVFVFFLLLPMMIPPHVTAIAWIQALGPASPVLQALHIAPEVGSTHPL